MPPAPDLADFEALAKAREVWGQHRLDEALAAFERALAERPDNIKALIESARAFGQRHEVARAEQLLQHADALAGSDTRVAPVIAQAYASAFRPAAAIERLEALRDAGGSSPLIFGELARLYEQSGKLAEANEAIERCVSLAPGRPEPIMARARIQRRIGEHDAAFAAFNALATHPQAPPIIRAEAWTEISYILDARQDYDGALRAIEQAKEALRSMPYAQQMIQRAAANNQTFADLAKEIDRDTFERWARPPFDPDPRCAGIAHLVGFPRSGTTLLEQILDAHPGLADSPERVVFTRDIFPVMYAAGGGGLSVGTLEAIPRGVLEQQRTRYLDYMEAALGEPLAGRVHLDKNPNHVSVIAGLVRLFPESRFVVALRDPRDVVVSCYMRSFRLTEFSAAMLTWRSTCEMYAHEMLAWLRYREALPEGSWVQVRYEDTVADVEREARRALDCLGLPWDDSVHAYRERTLGKVVNSPTAGEVRKPVYTSSIARWKHYTEHLEPHMALLEPFIREFGYDA